MEPSSSSGRSVPVVIRDKENHCFILDDEALTKILLKPEIADKKVAIISVAGVPRIGKSFLLNFFLRFLKQSQRNETNLNNWLESSEDLDLNGFYWRSGYESVTTGILLWSEPFIATLPSGEQIALLLMDTQGTFDTVFALSTMLSSLQIYNLSGVIREFDLQHLQLFAEYGRLSLELSTGKPFQTLIFLIRDWCRPYETPYGFAGGQQVLNRFLKISDKQRQELQLLRKHINACFSSTECFLMPHPGLKVFSPDFRGQLNDVETEFKKQLNDLIRNSLSPSRLVLKEIDGQAVTCRELLEYFRSYIKIFQGDLLPEPKSLLLRTAEANNLEALTWAKTFYSKKMEDVCSYYGPYLSQSILESKHNEIHKESLKLFSLKLRKMVGDDLSRPYLKKLDSELNDAFESFVKVNYGTDLTDIWSNFWKKCKYSFAVLGVILLFITTLIVLFTSDRKIASNKFYSVLAL